MPSTWLARESCESTQTQISLSGEKEIEEMYHQGNNNVLSSRRAFLPESRVFQHGGNVSGDSGLVLSTDAKPRLKWTAELHERFIEAVDQLGGPDKATPKTIMRIMGIPGLTLYHLKSHLQKYRLSKNVQQANKETNKNATECTLAADRMFAEIRTPMSNMHCGPQANKTMQISEALQMQIEVQRRLHEQLEVQRHLQLRIEAHGKYLQTVLEKAQETLEKQNSGPLGLEAAKQRTAQLADYSTESCMTSCDGSQKDHEIHIISLGLNADHGYSLPCRQAVEDNTQLQIETFGERKECKTFTSSRAQDSGWTVSPLLTMSVTDQSEKNIDSIISPARWRERDEETPEEQQHGKRRALQQDKEKTSNGFELPWLTAGLDLNTHDENYAPQAC